MLLSLFSGRQGKLENTVFCVLDSNGTRRLTRAGRGPGNQFSDAADFASYLESTWERYSKKAKPLAELPVHDDLRLALNVASCDLRPLVVLRAKSDKARAQLTSRVAELAWEESHVGRQHFVVLDGAELPEAFAKLDLKEGLTVLEPNAYGTGATVLAHEKASAKPEALARALDEGRAKHDPDDKVRAQHVRTGRRSGIEWESEIPETDPEEEGSRRKRRGR